MLILAWVIESTGGGESGSETGSETGRGIESGSAARILERCSEEEDFRVTWRREGEGGGGEDTSMKRKRKEAQEAIE